MITPFSAISNYLFESVTFISNDDNTLPDSDPLNDGLQRK